MNTTTLAVEEITEKVVTKYALRARKINLLEKKQKDVRATIIISLTAGNELPDSGPYTLDLVQNGGKAMGWEGEYQKMLTAKYKKSHRVSTAVAEKLAEQEMKLIEAKWPNKPAVVIHGKEYVGGVKLITKARV